MLKQVAYRNRSSPYPLVQVPEAQNLVFSHCPQGELTEIVDITQALNRVLAEDVYAKDPLPPFNASIKDGYAVKASDGAGIRVVRDSVAAGDVVILLSNLTSKLVLTYSNLAVCSSII